MFGLGPIPSTVIVLAFFVLGLIAIYLIIRFASAAVFNSYFEAKQYSEKKGEENGKNE